MVTTRLWTMRKISGLILALCFSAPAAAVWRCELAGKITYSDQPCTAASGYIVPEPDALNAEEVRAAQTRAVQDKLRLRQSEERQRADEERALRAQRLHAKEAARNKKTCDSLALQKKWREEELAQATPKSAENLKQKARRAAERYAMECKS